MRRGVTLVELLVAIAVFSFIISSAYLLLRQFSRTFSRGVSRAEMRKRVRLLVSTLSRDISSMYYRCEGSSTDFAFFSLRRRGKDFKVSEIRYTKEGDRLYRAVEWDSDGDLSRQDEKEVFLDNLEILKFSFYNNGKWQTYWSEKELPEVVKLKVKWKDFPRQYEIEFKVMSK